MPSIGFVLTTFTSDNSARVGMRSIAEHICVTTVPALITPGQEITSGDLTPPSSVDPLRPRKPSFHREPFGPLSLKYTTIVFFSNLSSLSFERSRPTFQSIFSHIASAARVWSIFSFFFFECSWVSSLFLNLFHHLSGTCIGECGVLYGR